MRGVWCQALSLPWPPVPWGGQQGFRDPCFPGAVGVGVEIQHRHHSVCAYEPLLHAVGVAGGRPLGVPFTVVRGVWVQALSIPGCPSSGQAVGVRYSRAVGAGVRAWGASTVP